MGKVALCWLAPFPLFGLGAVIAKAAWRNFTVVKGVSIQQYLSIPIDNFNVQCEPMKMKSLPILFFLALGIGASAQTTPSNTIVLPPVIPPSPNAASLGKYGDIPVSNYTGVPNISIPLFDIKEGDIHVPISLNYHASGIRVEEEASWMGLGWSLDAGGVVTKSVVGLDDEFGMGYLNSEAMPEPTRSSYVHVNGGLYNWKTQNMYCTPRVNGAVVDYSGKFTIIALSDQQPDRYYYNFGGASGKFVIDKAKKVLFSEQQKVKITYAANGWVITASNGLKYEFYDKEAMFNAVGADPISASYYLTKITSPTGDVVNFFYENTGAVYSQPSLSEGSYSGGGAKRPEPFRKVSYTQHNSIALSKIVWRSGQVIFERDAAEREDVTGANRLKKVKVYNSPLVADQSSFVREFEMTSSYFISQYGANYSAPTDVAFSKRGKRLRLDKVTERNGATEKPPYVFSYNSTPLPDKTSYSRDHWGYYNGAYNTTLLTPYKGLLTVSPQNNNKNYLDLPGADRAAKETYMKASILEKIEYPTGGTTSFEYSAHRGKYNGVGGYRKTVSNTYKASIENVPPSVPYVPPSEVTFTAFSLGLPYNGNGNGVADCKFTIGYSINCQGIVSFPYNDVRFQLFENGQLIQTWFGKEYPIGCTTSFRHSETNFFPLKKGEQYKIKVTVPPSYEGKLTALMEVEEITLDPDQEIVVGGLRVTKITDYDGFDHTKDKIKQFEYAQGELMTYPNNERVYEDGEPSVVPGNPDQAFYYLQRTSSSNVPLGSSAQGSPIGYSQVSILEGPDGENGKTVFYYHNAPDFYLPYADRFAGMPTFPDLKNGYVKRQEEYKKLRGYYYKVREKSNTYELANQATVMAEITEERYNPGAIQCVSLLNPIVGGANRYYHYYEIPSAWVKLKGTVETVYGDAAVGASPQVTTTDYYYDNPVHYLANRTVVANSKNEKVTTYVTYPEDYTDNGGFIKDLQNAFIVTTPIEKATVKETSAGAVQMVAGEVNTFKPGSKGLKDKMYQLKLPNDGSPIQLTNFKLSNKPLGVVDITNPINNTAFGMDTRYEERVSFAIYDSEGNIQQVQKTGDIPTTYLWGYNATYPIAEVKNATLEDVKKALGNGDSNVGQSIINELSSSATLSVAQLNQLNALKGNAFVKNALITTYTYIPLWGVNSITDPNGIATFYEYDGLGRLKLIKNSWGEIIKKWDYNYQIR
jgi:YD repeat-containing protein